MTEYPPLGGRMKTNQLLGGRIRELRRSRRLSQEQLAERMDISAKYVSQVETGVRSPSLEALEKFAIVLDVEIRDLFEFHPDADSALENINILLQAASEEQRRTIFRIIRVLLS
jgi:transcriptional regulator with XRE-family HTH domain